MVDSRFTDFSAATRFVVQVGLIIVFIFASHIAIAQQSDELLPPLRLSSQQANMLGLERKVFDFKEPKINFETIIPKNAHIVLNSFEDQPIEDGQIGRVLTLGKLAFSYEGVNIEQSIYAFKLRYAPAALRTCQWQMQNDDYLILHSMAKDKLVEAQIFGVKFDKTNKTPINAEFGFCYARGDVLVAHFFSASLSNNNNKPHPAIIDTLKKIVSYFVSNMLMGNGKENGVDESLIRNMAIDLSGNTLVVTYPTGIDVKVDNSERKILPYEFHFVQELQNGEMFSHLFLWINKANGPNSEESFRRQADIFTEIYISSQLRVTNKKEDVSTPNDSDNNEENDSSGAHLQGLKMPESIAYKYVGRNSIPGFAQVGIMARSYQYKIIDKNSPDYETMFFVSVIGYKDKTYVLYYHSLRGGVAKASEYFTGIAGDIAYDSIRKSLYDFLVKLK